MPSGCHFSTRCSKKFCEKCVNEQPPLFNVKGNHEVACWLYDEEVKNFE